MTIKKLGFIAILCALLHSCVSDKKILNSYLEHNISEIIQRIGPPAQVSSDEAGGKIYLFSSTGYGAGIYAGTTFYKYVFLYAYKDGTVYNWLEKRGSIPPQQVNVDLYVHH
jgi:hypothetical protein